MQRYPIVLACAALLAACSGPKGASVTGPGGGNQATLAYAGDFHPVAHSAGGSANVYVLGGSQELRFTSNFSTEANPNLEVWLVDADDPMDNHTVEISPHLSLGPLKSATGAQVYPLPPNTDLMQYRSVTVWCVSAHVNFATAPLMMQ
ncbi:MAG: DM13 domain-containing protein [Gemmatimonadales bacterium]